MNKTAGRLLVIVLFLGLMLPAACAPKAAETPREMGNTNSNIMNMGFSVTGGEWIYFTHQDQGWYQMKKDGSGKP